MNANLRFAVAGCLLAGTGICLQARHNTDASPPRPPFVSFPHQVGNWTGEDETISKDVLDVLGSGDFLARSYQEDSRGKNIDLFMAYFPSQRAGETIHSPRNCLPGSGWLPLESSKTVISLPGYPPFPANRYIIAKGGDRRLVLYWYRAHSRSVASEYLAKFYLVADSLRFNRSDGSLIRIITPLATGETAVKGQQRLLAFANNLLPLIDTYVPR